VSRKRRGDRLCKDKAGPLSVFAMTPIGGKALMDTCDTAACAGRVRSRTANLSSAPFVAEL